jgi:hypothetical protein
VIALGVTAFVIQDSGMIAGSEGDSPEGAEHDVGDDGYGDTMTSAEEDQADLGPRCCTADLDQLWSPPCDVLLVPF